MHAYLRQAEDKANDGPRRSRPNAIFPEGQFGVSMGSERSKFDEQSTTGSTPEDVAALYAWANLHGAKYRDYSASRREHRAQVRYLAAKTLLERELKAQADAEEAAEAAEHVAAAAEALALAAPGEEAHHARFAAMRTAEAAALKAAGERVEAARRAEAATHATVLALREERELAEAHASANQQATIYTEADELRKRLAGPQPRPSLTQEIGLTQAVAKSRAVPEVQLEVVSTPAALAPPSGIVRLTGGTWKPLSEEIVGRDEQPAARMDEIDTNSSGPLFDGPRPAWLALQPPSDSNEPTEEHAEHTETTAEDSPGVDLTVETPPPSPDSNALMDESAEHPVDADEDHVTVAEKVSPEPQPPVVAVPKLVIFSPIGGAGATSLVANLGRALAALGEKIVLVDATAAARLPYAFGGKDLTPGLVRTYWPPENEGEPLVLFRFEAARGESGDEACRRLCDQIAQSAPQAGRALLDLMPSASALTLRLVRAGARVLVPLTPVLDSLKQVEACERFLSTCEGGGSQHLPWYMLNRFDSSSPLHRYMRSRLREVVGDRLLQPGISDAAEISQAFDDGDNVLDYAPDSEATQQYRDLAARLREMSPLPDSGEARLRSTP